MNDGISDDQLKGLYLELSGILFKLTDEKLIRYDTTVQGLASSNPDLNEVVDYLREIADVQPELEILNQSAVVQCAILKECLEGMLRDMKIDIDKRNGDAECNE